MPQFLRPSSTVSAGSWAAVNAASLWEAVDEATADDTDYADGTINVNSTCELSLSVGNTPNAGTRTVRYRYRKNASGGNARDVTVSLYEGATLINEQTHTGISEVWTAGSFTVSGTITDYGNLRLRLTAAGTTGGPGGNRRATQVSWAELEIPDAPVETAKFYLIT